MTPLDTVWVTRHVDEMSVTIASTFLFLVNRHSYKNVQCRAHHARRLPRSRANDARLAPEGRVMNGTKAAWALQEP